MSDKMEDKSADSLPNHQLEENTEEFTESLENKSDISDHEELIGEKLAESSFTSLTDLKESSLTKILPLEKAEELSKYGDKENADVDSKEEPTLLSLTRQYQQHKLREFTEIQNPLNRHRRNYKVSKRKQTESNQKGDNSTAVGSGDMATTETQVYRKNSRSTTSTAVQGTSNTEQISNKNPSSSRIGDMGSGIMKDINAERNRRHVDMGGPSVFTISNGTGYEGKSPVDSAIDLDSSAENTSFNGGDLEDLTETHVIMPFGDVHLALELEDPTDLYDDDLWPDEHWIYVRDIDLHLQNQRSNREERSRSSPYRRASLTPRTDCEVCYEKTSVRKRLCCDFPVCDPCMEKYVEEKVTNGVVTIQCIGYCKSFVHRDEILSRLSAEMKEKYYRFLVNANQDPMVKTCPQCSTVYNMTKEEVKTAKKKAKGLRTNVTCSKCELVWCFPCQAPAHQGITCKEFAKGDKLLKSWAKVKTGIEWNAQQCPRCKVFIQRKGGCDHMTCKQCGTSFCYRCGERYITNHIIATLIGDHHGKFSPFGCKHTLLPNDPCARKLIRGSILGAKVLGGILLGGLIVAAGVILVGTSFIVVPAYTGYRYHKQRKNRKRFRTIRNINLARHFLPPPEIPQLMVNNTRPGDTLSENSSIFGSVFDEMDNNSTNDESPESGAEHDPSQEVEVWVHCHNQNSQTDPRQEVENTGHLEDVLTQTTAKLSKDQDQGEVLHVKTSYASVDHDKSTNRKDSSEIQESNENHKAEESFLNVKVKNDSKNRPNDLNGELSDSDSSEKQSNKNQSDKDEELGEENSTTQGCFVRIFGKKLPVVWEKGHDDEMIKTLDSKQKEHSGSSGRLQGHSSKTLDGNLEKKKILPSSITLDAGSLDRNLKKHVSGVGGVKVIRQPDIVTCVLQSKQANHLAGTIPCDNTDLPVTEDEGDVTLKVDPYFGVVSPDNYETTL
ncbi:uncharacterized protein DDB_G0292642-like isoform X2 [Pecten maximus]|nr:uncharacterized protein DDB_G0292642-like isoform X2 [Pecten maximus]